MKVLRDPQIISGFVFEQPVDELPELTHCGEALCCEGHYRGPHTHPAFEFLYLSRGRCTWRAHGETSVQHMGDLYIAYPGEKHSTGPKRNPENHHLWMGVDLEKIGRDGVRLAARLRAARPRLVTGCEEVEPVLRALMRQVVAHRTRRTEAIVASIRLFIVLLEQRLDAAAAKPEGTEPAARRLPYSHAVQKAMDYLQQNLERRLPLTDLAAVATARSVPHFCTQFRREVGLTPAAFHLQLRLNAAREALRQPAIDVTTAAQQYGFSSSQHFSTQFRRAFGVTPRAWRRGAG
ncbi:MAG TPA: AraC family transcriptional regulator [Opitutaceae bacterium]|nr:AraC family transcriptional regulator [Opitutaceae bacterium]